MPRLPIVNPNTIPGIEEEQNPSQGLLGFLSNPVGGISNAVSGAIANMDFGGLAKKAANAAMSPAMLNAALPAPMNVGNLREDLKGQILESRKPRSISQDGKDYTFTPGPEGSLTAAPPSGPTPPLVPEMTKRAQVVPGMPPDVTPDMLADYLGQQRGSVNRFGPEERLKLQSDLDARQNSFGNKATEGLKGFADALMMGVAGAGNPNWQGQYQAQENRNAQSQLSAFDDARNLNLQQTEADMSLDKMDPNSEVSRMAQQSYAPFFVDKLGYRPEQIKNMSAANIDTNLALMAQYGGKEIEADIKRLELETERAKMAAIAGQRESEDELARDKMKTDAAMDTLKRDRNARVWGVPIPLTSDVSGAERKAARQTIMDQIDPSEQPPFGRSTVRDGVEYEWSPKTGKYHRKQG